MSAIGFIFLGIFLWIFYNLFVKVIWPVYKTTSRLKKQFRNMAEQRETQNHSTASQNIETPKEKVGEYIEFEEVK
ncbi:hypothetical protein ACLOAU_07740 [Niabella sp. CJ426]|jgi:uncharacterized protein YoxC|uniref:hypothetical protein n=1 Tax=Niabella sp. CJ426 TaxID=3393740 RepID=UPI003D04B6A5